MRRRGAASGKCGWFLLDTPGYSALAADRRARYATHSGGVSRFAREVGVTLA